MKYIEAKAGNLKDIQMHLTNYAINKDCKDFQENTNEDDDFVGHKRSVKSFYKYLAELGHDAVKIQDEIKKIIIKTMISG